MATTDSPFDYDGEYVTPLISLIVMFPTLNNCHTWGEGICEAKESHFHLIFKCRASE